MRLAHATIPEGDAGVDHVVAAVRALVHVAWGDASRYDRTPPGMSRPVAEAAFFRTVRRYVTFAIDPPGVETIFDPRYVTQAIEQAMKGAHSIVAARIDCVSVAALCLTHLGGIDGGPYNRTLRIALLAHALPGGGRSRFVHMSAARIITIDGREQARYFDPQEEAEPWTPLRPNTVAQLHRVIEEPA